MPGEKFTLMQYSVNAILGLIEANDFVIPEIQRPFVWKRSQVRDLIDSLYHGYPTGYIITWKNPSVRTKDGGYSQGKKVLIDGQQRITALMAAISGKEVLDEDFKKDRIKIAFNPLAADDSKRFAVQDASHLKDKKWIPDISVLFSANFKPRAFENEYAKNNPNVDLDELADEIMRSIQEKGFKNFLSEVEASALSDTFWTVTLPQNLETSSVNSPAFNVFLAAQVHLNCNSLLMNGIKVSDLITVAGDIHHIFPRAYLKKNGIDSKTKYNQVANYIYLDTQVNKAISDDAPCNYFSKAFMQCETKAIELGNICNLSQLNENLQENCIPLSVKNMDASSYEEFLTERRKLMASMMKRYYWGL